MNVFDYLSLSLIHICAIVKNPDILLCDEPTGALDYATSKEILKLIETVNQKYGNTIIMVTHNDAIQNMACLLYTSTPCGRKCRVR